LQKINDKIGEIDEEVGKIAGIEKEISEMVGIQVAIDQIADKILEIVTKAGEIGNPQQIVDILAKIDSLGGKIDEINKATDIKDVREQVAGILYDIGELNNKVAKIAELEKQIGDVSKTVEGIQKTLAEYKTQIDANKTGIASLQGVQTSLSGQLNAINGKIDGLAKLEDIPDIESALADIVDEIADINKKVANIAELEASIERIDETVSGIEKVIDGKITTALGVAKAELSKNINDIKDEIDGLAILQNLDDIRDRLDGIDGQINEIYVDIGRIDDLESRIVEVDKKVIGIQTRVEILEDDQTEIFIQIKEIKDEMEELVKLEKLDEIGEKIEEINNKITAVETSIKELADAVNLVIGFVYFSNDDASPVTNSFVEIYNPENEPVTLNGKYYLQYKDASSSEWLKLNLEGQILAKRSFLVNLGTAGSPVSFTQTNYKVGRIDLTDKFDQNFAAVYGKTHNDVAVAIKAKGISDYLDLVGVGASETCEGTCLTGSSKDKGFARKKTTSGYTDSDNNSSDFVAVDFLALDLTKSICFPRGSKDGALTGTLNAASVCSDAPAESYETIGLQPGSDATGVNFNWYSSNATTNNASWVRILSSTDKKDTQGEYETPTRITGTSGSKFNHRVGVKDLQQGTQYKYQLSNDGANWGEVYSYKTTPLGSFKFAAVSDAQIDAKDIVASNWKTVAKKLSDAEVNFIVHTGDQVDATSTNVDTEYNGFFVPELRSIPFAPIMGNHDSHCEFLHRYNLPNEQNRPNTTSCTNNSKMNTVNTVPTTFTAFNAGNYYYRYNNVLFIGLNTAYYPGSKAQADYYITKYDNTIKAAIAANSGYDFIVVHHHKSTQTIASHAADSDVEYYVQAGLEKIMTENKVSLVLSGHDHINVRSKFLVWNNGKSVPSENDKGTVYLTLSTASGVKYYGAFAVGTMNVANSYSISNTFPYLVDGTTGATELRKGSLTNETKWLIGMETYHDSNAANSPEYTIVDVSSGSMTLKTYQNSNNALIDQFTITTDNIPE
jgi:predicted MPP superfamily phosphohydrolase/predicted  nucleic acid-binding Zn-ribbon protein